MWCPRPQAIGAHSASHLPLRFSAKPSKGAPWARRLLSVFWERGSPNLPTFSRPIFISPSSSAQAQDPREGPSLAGQTTGSFLRSSLIRRAREEAERSRQGTSRGARDASHDNRDQAGAGLRSVLVSPLVQRGKAQAKASGKGYRFGATRPRPVGQQDGGHRGAQDGVTTRAFGRRRLLLSGSLVLAAPFKLAVVGSLPT